MLQEILQKMAREQDKHLFPDNWDTYLQDFIPRALSSGVVSLQQVLDITDQQMEQLYAEGFQFYQNHQLDDASTAFRFLVFFDPWISKYWMGLAACQQRLKHYDKALHSYAIITALTPQDPYPHFYAYQCFEALNQKEDAHKALLLAYERSNDPTHLSLRKKIQSLHSSDFSSISKT